MNVVLKQAAFPQDEASTLAIFREYIAVAPVNLDFQHNENEFQQLAQKYTFPDGAVLLLMQGEEVIGCAAFRRVNNEICEMKRVYVRPNARGCGYGERLVTELMRLAKTFGYQRICLDVLPHFKTATELYLRLGFSECAPVSFNPVPETLYLGKDL